MLSAVPKKRRPLAATESGIASHSDGAAIAVGAVPTNGLAIDGAMATIPIADGAVAGMATESRPGAAAVATVVGRGVPTGREAVLSPAATSIGASAPRRALVREARIIGGGRGADCGATTCVECV